MNEFDEQFESLKQYVLDAARQSWFLGAGVSFDANIPLMYPLTARVEYLINQDDDEDAQGITAAVKSELPENCHVEHYLSHLGDLIAIASRAKTGSAQIGGSSYSLDQLVSCHGEIVKRIGEIVRYGYRDDDNVGTIDAPIVDIQQHVEFVDAVLASKANLEARTALSFFTTNYDTLLEDALSLRKVRVVDGFSGGSVAFWNPDSEFPSSSGALLSCPVYKLHGSVDWHRDSTYGLVRVRYGTKYLPNPADIMIYPQSTKYVETRRDPFARLFSCVRTELMQTSQNVFATCGYSFGDEHINAEIEQCLASPANKTTVVALVEEQPNQQEGVVVNPTLDRWLCDPAFGDRIFVAGGKGLYNGSLTPQLPEGSTELDWWKFSALIDLLKTGEL